jgi:hypothetical protein
VIAAATTENAPKPKPIAPITRIGTYGFTARESTGLGVVGHNLEISNPREL